MSHDICAACGEHRYIWNRDMCAACVDGETILRLSTENARLRDAYDKMNADICQTLGQALGYPWYCDDQKNFPGASKANGVCVGEHVAESIAVEAARTLTVLKRDYATRISEMASAVRQSGCYQSDGNDEADAGHLEDVMMAARQRYEHAEQELFALRDANLRREMAR